MPRIALSRHCGRRNDSGGASQRTNENTPSHLYIFPGGATSRKAFKYCAPIRVQEEIHSAEHDALRELLKGALLFRKLSQVELAARWKTPESFVSKVERGERALVVAEFFDYVVAIGVKPAALFADLVRRIEKARRTKRA